jgi:hypothetical protein
VIVLLLACRPCPDGLERDDAGVCVGSGPVGSGDPPTEDEFLRRYDARVCDALEDCLCDEVDDCDADVDCPEASVPAGCVYDELYGQECLDGHYSCDLDDDVVSVTPPEACELVYDCNGDLPGP